MHIFRMDNDHLQASMSRDSSLFKMSRDYLLTYALTI